MSNHSIGWIQNPNNFGKLKKIVQVFVPGTSYFQELVSNNGMDKIYYSDRKEHLIDVMTNHENKITFDDMKGKKINLPNKKGRSNQVADGIAQLAAGYPSEIHSDKEKTWTDEYTAGSFVNWALTFNFLKVNDADELSITEFGKSFANTKDGVWKSSKTYQCSDEEISILKEAISAYPPAIRILTLLEDNKKNNEPMSKFQLGSSLGFSGEPGFTSFNEDEWFECLKTLKGREILKFKNNDEGSADKWARGIASWLEKLGLVTSLKKYADGNTNKKFYTTGYKITLPGEILLKNARGNSSHGVKEKYVDWRMFATKAKNKNYLMKRRAHTLKAIQKTSSIEEIKEILNKQNVYDGPGVLKSDIIGLIHFGLNIIISNGKYIWKDLTNDFLIPDTLDNVELDDKELKDLKDNLQNNLCYIDPEDIEIVEMAWKKSPTKSENTKDATLFEIKVMELMKKYMHLDGKHLGGAEKPDGFLYYKDKFGIIIDTKAYSNGYNLPINQQREMQDYIEAAKEKIAGVPENEWWKIIPEDIKNSVLNFLWVSSDFSNNYLSGIKQTHLKKKINGGAIDVVQLLNLSNSIRGNKIPVEDIPSLMNNGRITLNCRNINTIEL